jgi:hypothetical protein
MHVHATMNKYKDIIIACYTCSCQWKYNGGSHGHDHKVLRFITTYIVCNQYPSPLTL